MKKLLSIAACAIALTACNTPNHIEGRLALKSPLSVRTKSDKKATLAPGTYKTSLSLKKDGGEVRIHTGGLSRVKFSLPQLKANAFGKVDISPGKIGQDFGLQGKIYAAREDIDRIRAGSCVHHYTQEHQCKNEQRCVTDAQGKEHCGTEYVCEWVQVPVHGSEDIHEVGYKDSKNVSINLVKDDRVVAVFSGGYGYSEKITRSEVVSGCRL